MISVIIPALNEEECIIACIEKLLGEECGCEIIVVDGGSIDRTVELAERYPGVSVIRSQKGRGFQMDLGASLASNDILLFLHADTLLDRGWASAVSSAMEDATMSGGAFTFSIRADSWKYRLVEKWVAMRCKYFSLPYGDQAIFVRKSAFDLAGGYRGLSLMEDVDLVTRLKRLGPIRILANKAMTSERRWFKKGVIRTAAINQLVMLLYKAGVSPGRLARIYYR
jgi:rSAM/selenodomain-associated transferase 2